MRQRELKKNPLDYANDWNAFIRDCLGVRLDWDQRAIVDSVQNNRRTSVRSGHARGKDYTAAAISLTFLYTHFPSKVINTAPSGRQVTTIMMTEISKMHGAARLPLGGELLSHFIRMPRDDWYLIGFKASDRRPEAWTGYHSPNILVVVTEASGIDQENFNAIDGVLTGTLSRLLIVFNPLRTTGEAFQSTRSPIYAKHRLSCLKAPNVRAKKILIPGQVDYDWIAEKLHKPGWVTRITEEEADPAGFHDFRFEGNWYRPSDLFLVKVMGEFPREGEDQLIPLSWVEAANERWAELKQPDVPLLMGCDIAGMGTDTTVFLKRYGKYVAPLSVFSKADHMVTAGRIKVILEGGGTALIDTIGEGAGVHSRLQEMGCNSISAKFSESAEDLKDLTGEREFANMRAYCYWAVRDALDPRLGGTLALPPDDELTQELTAIHWEVQSSGKIKIIPKEEIKEMLGRSPDKSDALALSYFPTELNVPRMRFV